MTKQCYILVVCALLWVPTKSDAYEYHGRFLLGGYVAKEKLRSDGLDSGSNDAAAISSRFYLNINRIGARGFETVIDVRDKHDFFDKLDKERLQLTDRNSFQLRQLFVKLPPQDGGFYGTAGRFAIPEAGSIYTDGAEMGSKWNSSMSSAIFGGLNAKRPEQTHTVYNSDAYVYGGYFLYHPTNSNWERNIYLTNALTVEQVKSDIDRAFWYSHFTFQPDLQSRMFGLMYLDFVPQIYLQNFYLNYWRDLGAKISAEASGTVIDSLQYQRRQNIRERIKASPYREGSAKLNYHLNSVTTLSGETTHGLRSDDDRGLHEYSLTSYISALLSPNFSGQTTLGFRNNFVSDDYFARLILGYYSNRWELSLNEYIAYENYSDSTKTLTPIVSEVNIYYFFFKDLFFSGTFEYAWDSEATLMSGFFKVGYNFGSRDTPAVRNAAPLGRPQ